MFGELRSPGGGKKSSVAVGDDSIKSVHPPKQLIDQNAIECWKINAKTMIKRGIFSAEDAVYLLAYCNAHSMMLQCDTEMAGNYTAITGDGSIKKHPLVSVRNDAINQLARLGSLLGLNPASRSRFLGGGESEKANEFDEF